MGSRLPSVSARMHERFIVNLRVPPQVLRDRLPACVTPQVVNGYAVVSFCMLDLRGVTLAPLPPIVGPRSISCAQRYAILAESGEPAVFVPERQTNFAVGARLSALGFSAPHRLVDIAIERESPATELRVQDGNDIMFEAALRPGGEFSSAVFATLDDFAAFMAAGVRSYGRSRHEGRLTVLDLHKDDGSYEPLFIEWIGGTFVDDWLAVGAQIDSALRTTDAHYVWKYHGLIADAVGSTRS